MISILKDIYRLTKNDNIEMKLYAKGNLLSETGLILSLQTTQLDLKIESKTSAVFTSSDTFQPSKDKKLESEKTGEFGVNNDSEVEIEIILKNIEKKSLNIKVFPSTKVETLIKKVATLEKADPSLILISYHGSQLAPSKTLQFYEIKNSFILHYNIEKSNQVKVIFKNGGKTEKVKAPSTFEVQLLKDIISRIIYKDIDNFELKFNGELLQSDKRLALAFPKNTEEEFKVEIVS